MYSGYSLLFTQDTIPLTSAYFLTFSKSVADKNSEYSTPTHKKKSRATVKHNVGGVSQCGRSQSCDIIIQRQQLCWVSELHAQEEEQSNSQTQSLNVGGVSKCGRSQSCDIIIQRQQLCWVSELHLPSLKLSRSLSCSHSLTWSLTVDGITGFCDKWHKNQNNSVTCIYIHVLH